MSSFSFALRSLLRDLKAGELWVLFVAIVVAVAAMTAVGFFTDRVGRAIKEQASAVLAADVVVSSPTPIADQWLDDARVAGLEATEALSFLTMVLAGKESNVLTMITAVADGYPLRPIILHLDRRSYRQAQWALRKVGEETFLNIAGNLPVPGGISVTSLLWIRDHEPEIYKKKCLLWTRRHLFSKTPYG